MNWVLWGWIGVGLLVVAVVAIAVEVALMAFWSMAVAKRSMALTERAEAERGAIEADVQRLRQAMEETRLLWRPYRRVLRWLRHPLTIALWQSYLRRGAIR